MNTLTQHKEVISLQKHLFACRLACTASERLSLHLEDGYPGTDGMDRPPQTCKFCTPASVLDRIDSSAYVAMPQEA